MSAKQTERVILRLPYVFAVCGALVFALIFWQLKTYGREQKHYNRDAKRPADMGSSTLAWKQPVLPAL